MTLTFPLTSAGPGPHSVGLKFYKLSAEIAVPLRVILIPIFHTCPLWNLYSRNRVTPVSIQDGV